MDLKGMFKKFYNLLSST